MTRSCKRAGSIGRLTTVRAREGHSGPHAAHFWDAELAGGGALLDMASHGTEVARYLFGKDLAVKEVFAWGDTLVHGARTTGEDNAVMVIRFADGRAATCDVSWTSKGGLEGRFEVYGDAGRIVHDMGVGAIRAFIERPAGYLGEKADAETGWVFPVPDEVRVHGHDAMLADVVEAFREGREPAETLRDGYVVNAVLDAAYRSMAIRAVGAGRDRRGGPRRMTLRVPETRALAWLDVARDLLDRLAATQADAIEERRSGARRRSPRMGSCTCSAPVTPGSRSRRCSPATARTRASTRSSSCR